MKADNLAEMLKADYNPVPVDRVSETFGAVHDFLENKVGPSLGCLETKGVGVSVTEGDVKATGCVLGTLETGPHGGGAEVEVKF